MQFAHVTGTLIENEAGIRIVVTLDDRIRVTTVRDDPVASLMFHQGIPDARWTVDQLTQETIGTDLAEQGWEALAAIEADAEHESGPPIASYLVRRT